MSFIAHIISSVIIGFQGLLGIHTQVPEVQIPNQPQEVIVDSQSSATTNTSANSAVVSPTSVKPSPTPSSPVNTTSGSQTYVSKEMGVSFNYPKTWKAEYKKGRDGKEQIILMSPDFQLGEEMKGEMINIAFGASWIAGPESESTTAQEYVNQKMDFYTKNPLTRGVIQQVSFKNQPAFLKRTLGAPGIAAAWSVYGGKEFSIAYIYQEWTSLQESRFNMVISNLAFSAPAVANTQSVSGSSSGAANLHYKNSTLGIGFDYPATWSVLSEKDKYGKETVILKTNDFVPAQSSAKPVAGTRITFAFDQNTTSMAQGEGKNYAETKQELASGFYTMIESKIVRLGTQYGFFKRVDSVFTIETAYESRPLNITGTFASWSSEVEKAVNQMIATFSF